jgi:hypothetical protein
VETGVQGSCNYLKELDSGFRRNDEMGSFRLFTRSSRIRIHPETQIFFLPLDGGGPRVGGLMVWNLNAFCFRPFTPALSHEGRGRFRMETN